MSEENTTPEPTPEPAATVKKKGLPWLAVFGFRRRPGKCIPYMFNKWGWFLAVCTVGMIGMAAFAEYSMQPEFCNSCHIMEPYFQAWHASTHKNVACPQCHFEPGLQNTLKGKFQASSQAVKYITQTYGSKPHAEIHDSSCMRSGCHEKRVLEGKVNWTIKSITGQPVTIKFDHTPHLTEERRGKQLRCVSCHSQIVQGQHLVVTLDTCFLCHFKGKEHGRNETVIGGCKGCHDAPKAEIRLATGVFKHSDYAGKGVACENCHSDSVKGDGAVPRQVCWTCHNQPAQISKYGETKMLHLQHVTTHKVECSSCHVQIEHNLTAGAPLMKVDDKGPHILNDAGSCASCHEQMHNGPAQLFRGTGGRGVPDMPSPMFRTQVDCIACHKQHKQTDQNATVTGQTFVAVQDSCNMCHEKKYDGTLAEWKKTIDKELARAQDAYKTTSEAIVKSGISGTDLLKAQRLMDDADHNIRLVKLGHGVHNVNYAVAVLNVAVNRAQEAQQIAAGKPVAEASK